jgi:hypothetical protein
MPVIDFLKFGWRSPHCDCVEGGQWHGAHGSIDRAVATPQACGGAPPERTAYYPGRTPPQ